MDSDSLTRGSRERRKYVDVMVPMVDNILNAADKRRRENPINIEIGEIPRAYESDCEESDCEESDCEESDCDSPVLSVPKKAEKAKKKVAKTKRKKPKRTGTKRPTSAYMFFMMDQRPIVAEENPTASFGEITQIAARKWKLLQPKNKVKYAELAKKDKERYRAEIKAQVNKSK